MTIRTMLAAAALTLTTALPAFAQCDGSRQHVMSCADGTVYDADSRACVKVNT